MTKREHRELLTQQWTDFLSHPSVEHSLNVRMELTLKQRYATELSKKPTLEERYLLNEVRRTVAAHEETRKYGQVVDGAERWPLRSR